MCVPPPPKKNPLKHLQPEVGMPVPSCQWGGGGVFLIFQALPCCQPAATGGNPLPQTHPRCNIMMLPRNDIIKVMTLWYLSKTLRFEGDFTIEFCPKTRTSQMMLPMGRYHFWVMLSYHLHVVCSTAHLGSSSPSPTSVLEGSGT